MCPCGLSLGDYRLVSGYVWVSAGAHHNRGEVWGVAEETVGVSTFRSVLYDDLNALQNK